MEYLGHTRSIYKHDTIYMRVLYLYHNYFNLCIRAHVQVLYKHFYKYRF